MKHFDQPLTKSERAAATRILARLDALRLKLQGQETSARRQANECEANPIRITAASALRREHARQALEFCAARHQAVRQAVRGLNDLLRLCP